MSVKIVILFGFLIGAALSTRFSLEKLKCRMKMDLISVAKKVIATKLPNCLAFFTNITEQEGKNVDTNCVSKCNLENKGIFSKDGAFIVTGIRNYFAKFSNTTKNIVDTVEKIFKECKESSDTTIAKLKREGQVVSNCKFFGVFEDCALSGGINITDC